MSRLVRPLRIVIADDSALIRRLLSDGLSARGFDVVGEAANGDEALALCQRERPDVLSLDLAMPGLDGIGVLRNLRDTGSPVKVVVVSAFSPAHGARAVDALSEGAFELVPKPVVGQPLDPFLTELADKLRFAAVSRTAVVTPNGNAAQLRRPATAVPARGVRRTVVIASSTGGPRALATLLPSLPSPLGGGTLVVQHMPEGFTASLASRLDRSSDLTVREARTGDALEPSTVLLAPGGSHVRFSPDGRARLSDEPAVGGLRPRADLSIGDAAGVFGPRLLLVVLTGMGKDGLEGAREVKRRGGRVLVEAESTCTVYGMPRAVAEAGLADAVLPLDALAPAIAAEAGA
jgi:two-component system chemotaxis response regulator CheB